MTRSTLFARARVLFHIYKIETSLTLFKLLQISVISHIKLCDHEATLSHSKMSGISNNNIYVMCIASCHTSHRPMTWSTLFARARVLFHIYKIETSLTLFKLLQISVILHIKLSDHEATLSHSKMSGISNNNIYNKCIASCQIKLQWRRITF